MNAVGVRPNAPAAPYRVLRDVPEELALEMTLVENLQREDLNPVEQARAFQRLTDGFHLTQEQVAERTGKDRTTIANSVRLLNSNLPIQELLEEGRLRPATPARCSPLTIQQTRLGLARRIAQGGMTVRQVERFASRGPRARTVPLLLSQPDPNTKAALEKLQREYGTSRTSPFPPPGKPGQLIFEYYDDSDLSRLYDQLMRK